MKIDDYKDIPIVFEDSKIIVALKPHNIPSQEDSSGDMDMLRLMKNYRKDKEDKKGDAFIGLVHRLDRPTSGLMVFAKNSKTAAQLSSQILQKEFKKYYYAVIRGVPEKSEGELIDYLVKDPKTNKVNIARKADQGAKKAILNYRVESIAFNGDLSLVRIELITGRSHQIRVQFSNIGHPIFGDHKYGEEANSDLRNNKVKTNLALFATDLKFINPSNKEKLFFRAFPPKNDIPWSFFNLEAILNITNYDN